MAKFIHNTYLVLGVLLLIDGCFLLYAIGNLSISYYEAKIFFNSNNIVSFIVNLSCKIFGQNDYALRIPFLIVHFLNVILLYRISKPILKRRFDCVVAVMIYMILPGVLASAILVNIAGITIFMTLLIVYFEQKKYHILFWIFMFISLFLSSSFMMLFLSVFIYQIYSKNNKSALFSLILLFISLGIYGFSAEGKPRGYLLDTIGVFAAVFSPFVFMYFIYTIYRIAIKGKRVLLWFICISSFCFCAILSIRQRLELEEFLPFCVIATPLMVRAFFNSYRSRLPSFRLKYKIITSVVVVFLCLNSFAIIFNDYIYLIIKSPKKHFAYKYNVAKDLANFLHKRGIETVNCDNELALRLKFYGIKSSKKASSLFVQSNLNNQADFIYKKHGKTVARYGIKD